MPRQARIDAPSAFLCEEDRYLRQLVAYIHLNPLRAGIVEDSAALKAYPFTGHSALMGRGVRSWQDITYVLALFCRSVSEARRNLQRHVTQWSAKERCPELIGGGLIRSLGGWSAVKEAYRDGIRLASDERLLGSCEFVESTLKRAGEAYERRMRLQSAGMGLSEVIAAVCLGLLTIEMICDLVGLRLCKESSFCVGFYVVDAVAGGSQNAMRAS